MYEVIRPVLFRLDPEFAHSLTIQLLRLAGKVPGIREVIRATYRSAADPVEAFGLAFPNRVGLAAGYDKDGLAFRGLALLGFGHIELGTVTLKPQDGNPRPRVFRLVQEKGLINRMGFPGKGAAFLARRLGSRRPQGLILGVNLGKNMDTPLEEAASDYLELLRVFAPLADYLVVNVSSPNTIGLRQLQGRVALSDLLNKLNTERGDLERRLNRRVPLLVKLSPDLTEGELDDAIQVILEARIDGVVATNTTITRPDSRSPIAAESGGLSGSPLRASSTEMVRRINRLTSGKLPIIAAGGVMNPRDAKEKLEAGAVLVQVYSGLVYSGPSLVKDILTGLSE